jgi:hypothetical protein
MQMSEMIKAVTAHMGAEYGGEVVLVAEHYSRTIARFLENSLITRDHQYTASLGITREMFNTFAWCELRHRTELWAQKHGHPSVMGDYAFVVKNEAGADVELGRASYSYVAALESLMSEGVIVPVDNTLVYIHDLEKRARIVAYIEEQTAAYNR